MIGIPNTTVIETSGSTSLVEVGSNLYLNSISSGTGPELKYAGAPVAADQLGSYAPVGVEQTAGGYEVALQDRRRQSVYDLEYRQHGNFISFMVLFRTPAPRWNRWRPASTRI